MMVILAGGCTKVPPGYVGIKINQYGQQKGVEDFPLHTGRVWYNPFTTDVEQFPTFMQTVIWTRSPSERGLSDESISFNSVEGASINADIACSFHILGDKVPSIYIEFRQEPHVLAHTFIRNEVRDTIVRLTSVLKAMDILGTGKAKLLDDIKLELNSRLNEKGIIFDLIAFSGDMRVDARVTDSINQVIQQTQQAIQAELKVRQTKAEADQAVAKADGEKRSSIERAEGEAQSTLIKAKQQSEANRIINESLTPTLVQWEAVKTWDGKMPQVTGNATPFISLGTIQQVPPSK